MKTLILIRHAKSSWDDPALADRERPLNKRGKRDAPWMGRFLLEKELQPELMISSPAKRALKTAKIIAEEIAYPKKRIEIREELYLRGTETLIELIAGLDDGLHRVGLFGHNPDFTDLINRLSETGIDNLPTCGVVAIEFPLDHWRDCARQGGKIALFERPPRDSLPDIEQDR
ncbi:MAG: histidine phosphatase family protein [Methylococcaceae bacterium]|nr:histidine phosphatase family protein [Methylococcaceae bacterium]